MPDRALTLPLSNNAIGDVGADMLAEALYTNKTLIELDLSKNIIQETGAKLLATMLEKNTYLQSVSLHSNTINSFGVTALYNSLKSNVTLIELAAFNNVEIEFENYEIDVLHFVSKRLTQNKARLGDHRDSFVVTLISWLDLCNSLKLP